MSTATKFSIFKKRVLSEQARTAYLFLIIPLIYFYFIKIYPMFYNIYLSFTSYDLLSSPQWIGLANYREIVEDELFRNAIWVTTIYAGAVVAITLVISLGVAVLLNRKILGSQFCKVSLYTPAVISMIVVAMIWRFLFSPTLGPVNSILSIFGLPTPQWLNDPNLALPCLVIVTIWRSVGYSMIVFLGGLQSIPGRLYEAAELDGAGGWGKFVYITIPGLKPFILFAVITIFISVFKNFDFIYAITSGGPLHATDTLAYRVYHLSFEMLRAGYAAIFSVTLMLICLVFAVVGIKTLEER